MITIDEVKEYAYNLGAEACGIAAVDRFSTAPQGFRPQDIYKTCQSVVVFIKSMPVDIANSNNTVPYSHTAAVIYSQMDHLAVNLARCLASRKIGTVPLPSDVPYLHWEPDRNHGCGLLSMRHAARNAGLGILGKNTLLINQKYGNMVYIGAVLTDAPLPSDPLVTDFKCPDKCSLCINACPAGALDGQTVRQDVCRASCVKKVGRDFEIYACNECRKACPRRNGY